MAYLELYGRYWQPERTAQKLRIRDIDSKVMGHRGVVKPMPGKGSFSGAFT